MVTETEGWLGPSLDPGAEPSEAPLYAHRMEGFHTELAGPGRDAWNRPLHLHPPTFNDLIQLKFRARDMRDYWKDKDQGIAQAWATIAHEFEFLALKSEADWRLQNAKDAQLVPT